MRRDKTDALHLLATHLGILPGYVEQSGRAVQTSDDSRRALLRAVGLPADSKAQAADTWRRLLSRPRPPIAPCAVVRARGASLQVVPTKRGGTARLDLQFEDGRSWQSEARRAPGRWRLPELPWGYHRLTYSQGEQRAEQQLIVTPPRALGPTDLGGLRGHAAGIWANLYTLHSSDSWGFGDLQDLAGLCRLAGRLGAAFVGVNPLHALRNQGMDISPYSPISRIFRNMLYLHVPAIPEFAQSDACQRWLRDPATAHALAAVRDTAHIDYEAVRKLKLQALQVVHRLFVLQGERDPDAARQQAYRSFCEAGGEALHTFALYCALDAHFGKQGKTQGWCGWPEAYRRPNLPAVTAFARAHPEAIELHRFVQFELDVQLAAAAATARHAGLPIGLYQDLAIGTAPGGAEPWVFPELFVPTISVGAPPDYYAPQGQDWGLPPLLPQRLAAQGYGFFRTLLRHAFAHSGALRVDHVLGLFRLFWIPRGQPATLGAYVRYPHADLLSILALESHRHKALVIGEDLGTVPPEVPGILRRFGVLSSQVMYFEKTAKGRFKGASSYSNRALVTATTHDHIPIAGFATARDCELRRKVGHLPDDAALAAARAGRRAELKNLLGMLRRARFLPPLPRAAPSAAVDPQALVVAVHRFLRATPAPLVGLSLDDLAGERDPVNVPGVHPDQHPCWSRRLGKSLEALAADPDTEAAFAAPTPRRRR